MIRLAAGRAALLLLGAAGCGGGAREYPEAVFAPPPDTILTRYATVPAGAWLGGTRWVVVSQEFDEAIIADFATRSVQVLGGKGEAEIRHPFSGFSFAETAYVADWAARRLTAWDAAGRFAEGLTAPDRLRGILPRARDAARQWYFEVPPPPSRDGSSNQDSAAVVRATADLARFDTIVRLSPLDLAEVEDQSGRRFERRIFSGTDEWGVLREGTVWVARVYVNRVDWISSEGRTHRGPSLPDRIIEVTTTDLEHWLLQFPEELRSTAAHAQWSPIKPPFTEGLTAASGEVWLEKSRHIADSTNTYHIVDREIGLRYVAILPLRQGHVIAVGDTVALIAEQYAEGVRLMQAPIPRPAAPTGGEGGEGGKGGGN